ncbi:hypothetical protein BvCmsKKP067_04098 [Escherichia coli]|nr:hypothetical protein BvCmsKKP067_04098 [Escherichia coli]GIP98384.1 hypothetical protein EC10E094_44320 [Escherichia coli]
MGWQKCSGIKHSYLVLLLHSSVVNIPMVKLQKAITTLKYAIMG